MSAPGTDANRTRTPRAVLWVMAAAAWAALPVIPGAHAQSDTGVAIVGLPADHALTRQLQAELAVAGYRVSVSPDRVESQQELRALAGTLHVSGAIWAPAADDTKLRIWVTDLTAGKTVENVAADSPSEAAAEPRVAAMRIVELLRAGFRDLESEPETTVPSRAEPPPPVCVEKETTCEPDHPRFFVNIGPSTAISPGGLGPSFDLRLGVRWLVYGRWGIGAYGLFPTLGVTAEEEEGSARILIVSAGIETGFSLVADPASSWQPDIAAGIGAAIFPVEGIAKRPLESQTDLITSPLFYGRLGLSIMISGQLGLRPEVQCGALVPEAEVHFAGREVARWGQPFVVASLSLETGFP